MEQTVSVIAGLGNPGAQYASTRHNVGFMILERLLKRLPGEWTESHSCAARCFQGRFRGRKVLLVEPLTYMNESGKAIGKLMRQEKIDPEELLVIHDDMDLEPGRIRIRKGGSAGGHHGIESVIAELSSAAFLRLRFGVGHAKQDQIDHVLSTFEAGETPMIEERMTDAVEALLEILSGSVSRAMNQFNAPPRSGAEATEKSAGNPRPSEA